MCALGGIRYIKLSPSDLGGLVPGIPWVSTYMDTEVPYGKNGVVFSQNLCTSSCIF